MSKYRNFYHHLRSLKNSSIELGFVAIEGIVGFSLPPSARLYRAWWANDLTHTQAKAWLEAGWKVDAVDLVNETVNLKSSSGH